MHYSLCTTGLGILSVWGHEAMWGDEAIQQFHLVLYVTLDTPLVQ